ncbi:MAG TPA: FAD-dependent oxidoreductase [Methylomirabilota bacterium]|jgi:glycine/D-amino acid oxidase-like deaminating enzyme|nr:FAD-dependent oxidoreductase [Methylomirabilota bacterium]
MDAVPERADLVVVGGGVCGAVCAAEAARRGAHVVLLEKEADLAQEASGRSFGSLRLQGRHPAELPLAMDALELWTEAARTLGTDFEFVPGGNLYVAETAVEVEQLREQLERAKAAGFTDVRLLSPPETRELIPSLTRGFAAALYSPRDAHCDPRKAVLAYASAARRRGAQLVLGTKATEIAVAGGAVTAVGTDRGAVRTERAVIAAGVWTPRLVRDLGIRIPIKPIVYTNGETGPLPPLSTATLRAFRFSCRQRPSGELLIGAGLNATVAHPVSLEDLDDLRLWLPRYWANRRQIELRLDAARLWRELRGVGRPAAAGIPVGAHPAASARVLRPALHALQAWLPPARDATITRTWAGLLDLSPDGLPVIERTRRPDGLVLVTGLSGHGFGLAPVLGRILADLALDGRTGYDLTAFRLDRFEASVPMPARLV